MSIVFLRQQALRLFIGGLLYGLLSAACAQSAAVISSVDGSKSWPTKKTPIEQLPRIVLQTLSDIEFDAVYTAVQATQSQPYSVAKLKTTTCFTKFWLKKENEKKDPFMVNFLNGLTGYVKVNGEALQVRKSGGYGSPNEKEFKQGKIDEFTFSEINTISSERAPIVLELKKKSEKRCSFFSASCKIFTADAIAHWGVSAPNKGDWNSTPREKLGEIYIEDACHMSDSFGSLFYPNTPTLIEKFFGLFFSLS